MPRRPLVAALCLAVLAASGCFDPGPAPYTFALPPGFPTPKVPAENPMSEAKVALGRRLFYDRRLSANGEQACGSCHLQALAFTDGRVNAIGSTGQHHRRNAQGLANVAYATRLTWANGSLLTLEQQALVPLLGTQPVELGLDGRVQEVLGRFGDDAEVSAQFDAAFPADDPGVTLTKLVRALASFQRTLLSGASPYDRYAYRGEGGALSESAKRGMDLFFSERLECAHCHGGFAFADSVQHDGTVNVEANFHNTGLYDLDGHGAYPATDPGLIELTANPDDMGRFRAPSLRNVALTAPYMHDGSIATLSEVLDHYAGGGRARVQRGVPSPLQSELVAGFPLSEQERADVLAFLESLTDPELLVDPTLADPTLSP